MLLGPVPLVRLRKERLLALQDHILKALEKMFVMLRLNELFLKLRE